MDDEGEDVERLADAVEEMAMANYNLPRFKGEEDEAIILYFSFFVRSLGCGFLVLSLVKFVFIN